MIKYFRFSGKENCPCGSGQQFKNCCKKKKVRKFHTKGEAMNVMSKSLKKAKRRVCLVDGCEARAKDIILAHALQENRVLNKIDADGVVLMQNLVKNPELIETDQGYEEPFYFLEEVKIKDATVQTCFCRTHDNKLFEKIEKSKYDFSNLTQEQIFLFAYRTFAFEYYKDVTAKRLHEIMISETPQLTINPLYVFKYRHSMIKKEETDYYKCVFDYCLKNNDFTKLKTHILRLPYRLNFSGYSSMAPPFDLAGRTIKTISKKTKKMKRLFITVIPDETSSFVLISALHEDMDVYGRFFDSIEESGNSVLMKYLNIFIPFYSENLIINPDLYNSFDEMGQGMLQYLVTETSLRRMSKILWRLQAGFRQISIQKSDNVDMELLPYNLFAEV